MDQSEILRRRRATKWQSLRKLGAKNVRCWCGETDPLCFEVHHIYRREYDGTVWALCANCHRKISSHQEWEHPPVGTHPGDPFERLVHRLLGLQEFYAYSADSLREIAETISKLVGKGIVSDE